MTAIAALAAKLLMYPLVLVGTIVLLGMFSRLCRLQRLLGFLARPCVAGVALGIAAVAYLWLLGRAWTPFHDSTLDYVSGAAYLVSMALGVREVYLRWPAISRWLSYQTLLIRVCRCGGGCQCKDGTGCRCKEACVCEKTC